MKRSTKKLLDTLLLPTLPKHIVDHIQHLERIRQDFVANVSHELRTPLTVIHGYLEMLLDQAKDETKPWQKIFLQMQQQTTRMENLIEDLLLLSRLENSEEESDAKIGEAINVANLLETICHEAKELSGKLKHHIQLKVADDLLLLGNKNELRSLFSNIIFNAVKYTPANGKISVRWCSKKGQGYFSVRDTGIGIAKEHLTRLTERFYRVDPARSRASGGTGLGLAIAKHVLIRHQAQLDVHSTAGKGSVFTCMFPRERVLIS
jgi:two-component system, OmpR family, phosphate regulon sensor histidine kinase PhoR